MQLTSHFLFLLLLLVQHFRVLLQTGAGLMADHVGQSKNSHFEIVTVVFADVHAKQFLLTPAFDELPFCHV